MLFNLNSSKNSVRIHAIIDKLEKENRGDMATQEINVCSF